MPPLRPIAVTGSTGQVGGRVAARLAAAGVAQRLLVRDPARAPRFPGGDVRTIGGYGDGDGIRAALEGVETLLLIPAAEAPDRVAQHVTAIDAAVAAGVSRIVYLSFLGAREDATFTLARDHAATEARVRASGTAFVFPRMNLYLDFVPAMVGEDGAIRGPAGDGRVSAILRDDVAASVVAILTSDGHDGRTYDLVGPASFSLAEAAATIARATGRPVRFEDETVAEAWASRASYGAPDWEVEGWISSYLAIASGELDVDGDAVLRLTGRAPTSLEAYVSTLA